MLIKFHLFLGFVNLIRKYKFQKYNQMKLLFRPAMLGLFLVSDKTIIRAKHVKYTLSLFTRASSFT